MGRRKQTQSLKTLCIFNIAKNMEKLWCDDYYRNLHDQGTFMHVIGPFECLTPALIQELLNCLVTRNLMKRYYLHLLVDYRLESLDLGVCRREANKDSIINLVTMRCQRLTQLNIANCNKVSARVLADLVAALPNIMSLNLRHTKCNDQVLSQIGQMCKNLRELDAYGCPVTDMGLMSLCVSFDPKQPKVQKLWKIDIALNFSTLTHKGVEILLNNCKNLQYLYYPDISDALYCMYLKQIVSNEKVEPLLLKTLFMSLMKEMATVPDETLRISCMIAPNITEAFIHRGLTDEGLSHLTGLQNLRVLHLTNGSREETLTFEGGLLPFLTIRGSKLEELTLNEINFLDLAVIGHCCPLVKKFSCLIAGYNSAWFPMNTQPQLIKSLSNVIPFQKLRELKVLLYTDENNFPAQFLRLLLLNATKLQDLHLSQIACLDDDLLCQIFEKNKLEALRNLRLERCNNITLDPIYDFCEEENSLEHLQLKYCKQITRIDKEQLDMLAEEDNFDMVMEWS